MTPAEYKTAHEALGLTAAYIAQRCGVSVGRIWAYEHHTRTAPVPDHAAEVMRDLGRDADDAIDALILRIEASGAEVIERHVDLERFYALHPSLTGWGNLGQGLLLAEVQRRLQLPIEYVSA